MTTRPLRRGAKTLLGIAVCAGLAITQPAIAFAEPTTEVSGDELAPAYISGLTDQLLADLAAEPRPTDANIDALQTAEEESEAAPDRPSMHDGPAAAVNAGVAALADTCAAAGFASVSGQTLVNLVKASTTDCINTLFSVQGSQAASIFTEQKMVAVANALKTAATAYQGNNAGSAAQLVLFLRAGYYVQWYDAQVPAFGTALRTAVAGALDAFFANPTSKHVNDANGEILSEAITLIDSAELNDRYLSAILHFLTDFNSSYESSWWMLNAVNSTFTVFFRGHQVPAFVTYVAQNPSVLTTLRTFALTHIDLLGGQNAYLVTNAGRELGRFLGDPSVKAAAKPEVKAILDQTSLTGPTSGLWVAVAQMADWYDSGSCNYYGTCNLQERIEAAVLPITHACNAGITIRAQDMSATELADSCASLIAQDAYFHAVAKDPGPVPGDVNTSIEVVVFNSSDDYQAYAGSLYGIDTNNGGMYLEGVPSQAGNQARFIAYEAEWLRPAFAIWNLNHEYTHYLDGRFNMHGDFGENMLTPTIWWVEGFAEYISYHYRGEPYTAAQQLAGTGAYQLSDLFDTTYSHNTDRIYRWGYLAVSYMLNKQPDALQTVLGYYRSGDWNGARAYLKNSIGTSYNADFQAFLAACAAGDCSADLGGGDPNPPQENRAPVATFSFTADGLGVTFTNGSYDPDGSIASQEWDFGDGSGSTEAQPTKEFSASGSYQVTLTVTDDKGATATATRTVAVEDAGTDPDPDPEPEPGDNTWTVPVCADPATNMLGQACGRMGAAASKSDSVYYAVWVPAGTPRLTITAGGGTGDADLYVSHYGWASPSQHVGRSTNPGTGEQVVIDWPGSGWNYVTLHGADAFSNVSVVAHY